MRPHIRHGGAPLLRYRRKELLAAGVERVLARTVGVQDGLPVLDDGRILDIRNVVWCTGFRPDFSWIAFRSRWARTDIPCSTAGSSTPPPASTSSGLLFLHSFTSMLIAGTGRDAERVAKHIASQAGERAGGTRRPLLGCPSGLPRELACRGRNRGDDDPGPSSPLLVWNGQVTRMRWVTARGAEGRSGNLTSLPTARPSEGQKTRRRSA